METQTEVYRLKNTIKKQNISMVFSKRRLNSLDVFRNSLEKPHNTFTTQLVRSREYLKAIILEEPPNKNSEKYSTNLFL